MSNNTPDLWFAYDPSDSFSTFATEAEARACAEEWLEAYALDACEGWDEAVEQVCWGQIRGRIVETERRPVSDDDSVNSAIDEYVSYALVDAPVVPPEPTP